MGPSPGYALAQDLKKLLDRKNQVSYADFAQFLLHPKLGS